MEYNQPLEIEFSLDPDLRSNQVDFDTLLKDVNQEDFSNWFNLENIKLEFDNPSSSPFEATNYEPLPIVSPENWPTDDLIYIKPDPEAMQTEEVEFPLTKAPTKEKKKSGRRGTKRKTTLVKAAKQEEEEEEVDDKYLKRLEANKISAQASRERKKQLKNYLEEQMNTLSQENSKLGTEITQLETENKVLRSEFIQLQNLIAQSPILSKVKAQQYSISLPTMEQLEQKKLDRIQSKIDSPSLPLFAPSTSTDPSALMYLMVLMQTFNQYWNNQLANSTIAPMQLTAVC